MLQGKQVISGYKELARSNRNSGLIRKQIAKFSNCLSARINDCSGGHLRSFKFLAIAGLAVLLSGCIIPDASDNSPSLTSSWVRPEDPQEDIGAKEHPLVLVKYGGEYSNTEAEKIIAVVVSKLVAVSDDPSRVYKISILNSPKVNAFALPGGYLYVTRGLLALANDSSELAAVIAHEMAHVSSNHAILRREKLSSAALGEQVATEVLGGSAAGQVAIAANQIRISKFSKDQELQADAVGIRMIGRAGFDPFAAARFLETMNAYRAWLAGDQAEEDSESFLSSHPATPTRIELAKRHARFFGAPGVGETERERYLEGIDGILYGDTADEGFVRGQTFSHASLGVSFSAPKGFRIDNQPKAVMITGPADVATRFDASVLPSGKSLSAYLKSGWITGLDNNSVREEKLNGLPSATGVAHGEGWRFRIRVIRDGNQLYRFVTAAPQTNTQIDLVSSNITSSFRKLGALEIASLKPLQVKVVKALPGQGRKYLASRMRGVDGKADLLEIINSLPKDAAIKPGDQVKLISD